MTTKIEKMITDRLKHIEERISLVGDPLPPITTMYSRGYSIGKLHRLIAERYFIETLLEELEGGDHKLDETKL